MKFIMSILVIYTSLFGVAEASIYTYFNSVTKNESGYLLDISVEWDANDTTPNICYNVRNCRIYGQLYSNNSFLQNAFDASARANPCIATEKYLSGLMSCLGSATISGIGSTTKSVNLSSNPGQVLMLSTADYTQYPNVCFKLLGADASASPSFGRTEFPSLVCGLAPPPIGACETPDSLDLNHTTVNSKKLNDHTVIQYFNIICNQALSASLKMTGSSSGYLQLGDNLKSSIAVNGVKIAEDTIALNLVTGTNSLVMSSRLVTTGDVAPGDYQSQAVMILTLN